MQASSIQSGIQPSLLFLIVLFSMVWTVGHTGSTTMRQQIIIQFNEEADAGDTAHIEQRLERWQQRFDVPLEFVRHFGDNGWIISLKDRLDNARLNHLIKQLNQEPDIRYAELDAVMELNPIPGEFEGSAMELK